jgi:hypothetical protein
MKQISGLAPGFIEINPVSTNRIYSTMGGIELNWRSWRQPQQIKINKCMMGSRK